MKLMTSVLTAALMTGGLWAQNPNIINNVQNKMDAVEQKKTNDSNAALGTASKPAPGAPAPAVKPAQIPGAKAPADSAAAAKPFHASAPKLEAVSAPGSDNRLERVNVVRHAENVQIEISSREAVTPRVSKLTSPARVVVELPATAMATAQSKIAVDSNGVKGVRIGMNSKTPPTTSVVVDLDQALGYEMSPGPGNSLILTLHTQTVAKNAAAPAKAAAPQAKTVAAKPAVATPAATPKAEKVAAAAVPVPAKAVKVAVAPASAPAPAAATPKMPKATAADAKAAALAADRTPEQEKPGAVNKTAEAPKPPKPEEKKWAMNGKRDPFFSPVVQQTGGSGCSTGKKCLEIGQINLRGVVKAEAGFIAVVTNSLNKAYFLHENDPVFNGYVVRITGDSVVFQETVQDKLGKPLTREVTKKISTPAV